jgi:GTP-binding protein
LDIKNAQFLITAMNSTQYPVHQLPEAALVGRSNVGKSSLINALVRQKNLARVAAAPGKTRGINFYNINQTFCLVDLPGYGYARVSKAEKASWAEMIETYLFTRSQLRLIILVVDIRHVPSEDDQMMYEWIKRQGKAYLVVASKVDKISRGQAANRLREISDTLGMDKAGLVIPFSAATGQGRDEVLKRVGQEIEN